MELLAMGLKEVRADLINSVLNCHLELQTQFGTNPVEAFIAIV